MDTRHLPSAPPFNPDDPRPHWALMTPDGGPTWPDDAEIVRWRAAAFARSRRFVEDADQVDQARAGLFAEGGG